MLIISNLSGKYRIIASLLFGAGLRINEALKLRIKDIDFHNKSIFIFRGKGNKDRCTLLPENLIVFLQAQIEKAKQLHQQDIRDGFGLTSMPISLIKNTSLRPKILLGNISSHQVFAAHIHKTAIFVVIIFTKLHFENNSDSQSRIREYING